MYSLLSCIDSFFPLLSSLSPTKANSPRKSIASNVVGVQRATKATNGLAKGYYRPDLKSYARARIAALKKAVKPKGKKKVSKKSA